MVKGPDNLPPEEAHSPSPSSTSLTLVEQVKQGLPEGWRRLMELYHPLLLFWCRRKGLRSHDAEDVVQEVLATVATRMGEFTKCQEGGGLRSWLRTITYHKVGDFLRRLRHQPPMVAGGGDPERLAELPADASEDSTVTGDPAETERAILRRRALELARAEIEPRTWDVVWRIIVDERPPAEVAAELEMTVNAVYIAKSRVLARLRAMLGGLID
jgi:RNA polymerase sigma-70 factor (ECF subfamily)